ncbi:MAG: hypothetical protein KF782_03230 [Labilithrix sp.]|nr:hypothetical protein [Labilithrix sp.]
MELTHEDNTSTAADPQAIRSMPPPKPPVSDNDPTRNVTSAEALRRGVLVVLVAALLAVLFVATVWAVASR